MGLWVMRRSPHGAASALHAENVPATTRLRRWRGSLRPLRLFDKAALARASAHRQRRPRSDPFVSANQAGSDRAVARRRRLLSAVKPRPDQPMRQTARAGQAAGGGSDVEGGAIGVAFLRFAGARFAAAFFPAAFFPAAFFAGA